MARVSVDTRDPVVMARTHAELDRRVKQLDRKAWLSTDEQTELAQLKKQKLVLKDQLGAV